MAITGKNSDALNGFRAKIFKVLTGEKTPPNACLSFVPGGLPQSSYTLDFLKDPSKVDQAHDFAMLMNYIPLGVGDWVASGTTMWDRYSDWLDKYVSPPFSLSAQDKQRLEDAYDEVAANFDNYTNYQMEYDNAYFDWYDLYLLPKDERGKDYAPKLARAQRARDTAMTGWKAKGCKGSVEKALAIIDDLTRRDPELTKAKMLQKFGAPVQSPNGEYYPTSIYPSNPLDEGFVFEQLSAALGEGISWPKFTYSEEETKTYSSNSSYKWGGSASIGALLWSAGAEHEGKREVSEKNSDIYKMKIEFELLRAPILRPWFTSYYLTGNGWKWSTSTPEKPAGGDMFSDGEIPAEGSWTMIPTEAIFARNLKVSIDMSSSVNKESLTETKSSAQGGWGPFKIKGNVETSEGSKTFEFSETQEGIECAQPQIIAFYCQLMPKEPNPDWNLWKE